MARTLGVVLAVAMLALGACADDDEPTAASTTATAEDDVASGSSGCGVVAPADAGSTRETIEVDGHEREYALHVPSSYDGATPAPLILNLHGFSSGIDEQDRVTDLPALAGERGYVVVTPQGLPLTIPSDAPGAAQSGGLSGSPFWNFFGSSGVDFGDGATVPGIDATEVGVDDVAFFDALLDSLQERLCLDPDRLYSTGMSNGAGMTTTLACELGDRLAAVAPVAGVNLSGACPGDEPVPVRAVHGDADTVAAYTGNSLMGFELGNPSVPDRMAAWAAHNGCDPEPDVVDDGVLAIETWEGCEQGATVQLWTLAGWTHAWPRGPSCQAPPCPDDTGVIDATAVVLDFFDDHARQ